MRTEERPPAALVREWAVCGIVAAAARFVPIPVADDLVRDSATRIAVSRTLRAHGRGYGTDAVAPLLGESARRGRVASALRSAPRKVLLYPVRKWVAIFGSVRGVPGDVLTVVLLGRTLDRCLTAGLLPEAADDLSAQAAAVRRAFDDAYAGSDLRLARSALTDALSSGRRLGRSAVGLARTVAARRRPEAADELEPAVDDEVRDGAGRVERALGSPQVAAELDRFDRRVDERLDVELARLRTPGRPGRGWGRRR